MKDITIKCDRCGKEINKINLDVHFEIVLVEQTSGRVTVLFQYEDICSECIELIKEKIKIEKI